MHRTAKVWVVDDDSSIRWVLERALNQANIDNESFSDGDQLLQRIKTEQPDVIISDIRMPGATGLEMLEELRRENWSTPVILITAFGDELIHQRAKNIGANLILDKPFDMDLLLGVVRRIVPLSE